MTGTHILEAMHPDDFGNVYVPFKSRCVDCFGGLRGSFTWPAWLGSRDYFYRGWA